MTLPAGSALARHLFTREMRGETSAGAAVESAERITERLMGGLSRWFGPYGAQALATRALASAQAAHPILAGVTISETNRLEGLSAASGEHHDAQATIEAITAMIASLAQLLGRLIGEDLAISLLEQSTTASAIGTPVAADGMRRDAATKRPTQP